MGALFPGLLLGALYIIFIVVYGLISPKSMPVPDNQEPIAIGVFIAVLKSVVPRMGLILLVLGSFDNLIWSLRLSFSLFSFLGLRGFILKAYARQTSACCTSIRVVFRSYCCKSWG